MLAQIKSNYQRDLFKTDLECMLNKKGSMGYGTF